MHDFGTAIPVSHYPRLLTWDSDLQVYEGPILMKFRSPGGDCFLFCWCDQDETATRWLVVRVQERDTYLLLAQHLTLHQLLTKRLPEPHGFLVDRARNGITRRLAILEVSDLPDDYLPEPDAYLLPELIGRSAHNDFVGLLNGTWTMEGLAELSRQIQGTYNLLYLDNAHTIDRFRKAPFRGGFSTVNFYRQIEGEVPQSARAEMTKVAYASPGMVTFKGNPLVAGLLRRVIDNVRVNYETLAAANRDLTRYLKAEKLNDEHVTPTLEQDGILEQYACNMLELIGLPRWEWLIEVSPSTFQATKIVRGHFARLKELMRAEDEDRCILAVPTASGCGSRPPF